MSEGVEQAIHCCSVLSFLGPGEALPAARLAEFHGVQPSYLAKHLQSLVRSGVCESIPGPRGGFRLARPAAEVSLLDVVLAVDGDERAFRCAEIRQRGPAARPVSGRRPPCGIAAAMWQAEEAWRTELSAVTLADIGTDLAATVAPEQLVASAVWLRSATNSTAEPEEIP